MLCEAPKYTATIFLLGCPVDPAWGADSALRERSRCLIFKNLFPLSRLTLCTLLERASLLVHFNHWVSWSPYVIGQTIIFLPRGFFYLSFFFFPRLI